MVQADSQPQVPTPQSVSLKTPRNLNPQGLNPTTPLLFLGVSCFYGLCHVTTPDATAHRLMVRETTIQTSKFQNSIQLYCIRKKYILHMQSPKEPDIHSPSMQETQLSLILVTLLLMNAQQMPRARYTHPRV